METLAPAIVEMNIVSLDAYVERIVRRIQKVQVRLLILAKRPPDVVCNERQALALEYLKVFDAPETTKQMLYPLRRPRSSMLQPLGALSKPVGVYERLVFAVEAGYRRARGPELDHKICGAKLATHLAGAALCTGINLQGVRCTP